MAEPLNGQDALRLVLNVLRRVTDKDDRQRVVRALNEMFPQPDMVEAKAKVEKSGTWSP